MIEAGDAIPQRDVGRCGLLRLQCDDPVDGLDDVQLLAAQQQLSAQRRAIELASGQGCGQCVIRRPSAGAA